MKKLNLLKLLSCVMTLFVATVSTSCVDDNDDNGLPYLEVTPEVLAFTPDGVPEDGAVITVKTNRPWTLSIAENDQWVVVDPTEGKGTTKVEVSVPASNEGRVATLNFQLKNAYGAYITKTVSIEQGDAPEPGAVGALVEYIKANLGSVESGQTVELNYTETSIEAVILANNEYGNNFGKLYIGDNVALPNTGMILYSTSEFTKEKSSKYPVGSRVTLDLSNAKYAPYNNLRELKDVVVTVQEGEPETVVYPTLSAAQFNGGEYQGQYVKVTNVTPTSKFVGEKWATDKKRAVSMTAADGSTVQSYMATAEDAPAFAAMTIAEKTGAIFGAAEQIGSTIQILPTKPDDVAELATANPEVTTGEAEIVSATSVTLSGSLLFIASPTKVGFQYTAYAEEPDWSAATEVEATLENDSWTKTIDGLTTGQKYAYRAYATDASATYYGEMKSFTPDVPADIVVDFSESLPDGFPANTNDPAALTGKVWQFDGYDFGFYPSSGNKYYVMGGSALLIGKDGAYVTLPAIAGKSLAKVRCTVNTGSPSTKPFVGIYDASGNALQGGEAQHWDTPGKSYEYELGGTAVNTSYRIEVASGGANIQVAKIELWYNEGGTPGKPTVSVDPKTLTFGAAADETGKTVTITTENAGNLSLFAVSTDATQFPMSAITDNQFTVRALANTSETESKTATITVYLAQTENGTREASATIDVSQASNKPKTVAELRTQMKSMNPTSAGVAFPAAWIGQNVVGYIAANNASKNLNKMIAVVDNDNKPGSGMLLYDSDTKYNDNPAEDFPVGRKITITITADSKAKVYSNLIELTDVTTAVGTESVAIKETEITANDLVTKDYQGMYVKVTGLRLEGTGYKQWGPSGTGYVDFLGGTDQVSVATYNAAAWADEWISPSVTGAVGGIAQQNGNNYRIFPQKSADVAAFAVTEPAIVDFTPDALSFPAAGGDKEIDLTILNQGANAVTASGLTAPFSATVSGTKVKVSAAPNTQETAVPEQTLTLTLANGNSVTIPVTQLAAGGLTLTLDLSSNPGFPTSYTDGEWTIDGYTWGGYRVQYNNALVLQGSKNGWVSTPAVADMKLMEIQVTTGENIANSSKVAVKDAEGNIVSDEQLVGKNSADYPGPFTFPIENPAVNTSYRITATSANSQFVEIKLIYSK